MIYPSSPRPGSAHLTHHQTRGVKFLPRHVKHRVSHYEKTKANSNATTKREKSVSANREGARRGNGHKRKVSEKTKRRIVNPPSREESQSGECEPYDGRFTNTGHCDEPQTLHANGRHVHISDSDVLEVPKTDLPRRASTAPSDGRSSSADHMIVRGPSANQNQEPKRRDVSRRSHQQHDREDGISFTPLEPASYSGPRRRPPNAQSRSEAF